MDNGINDMAQVLNVSATYLEMSVKATKAGINLLKNLMMLMIHAIKYGYDKKLENSKGKVGSNKMNKLTKNPAWTKTTKDKDCEKAFLKLCRQHGIPVNKAKGLKESNVTHWIYPAEYSAMMESVMSFMQEYTAKKYEKEGMSKEDAATKAKEENRCESPEEAAKDLGCDLDHKEFKKQFLEQIATPEEKEYYEKLEKKRPQLNDAKKNEIKKAVKANENREKTNDFERKGMYSVVFNKDQIIGTVERNKEKYVKIRFENDYGQAFLVAENNVAKYGDKLYGGFDKNGDITIYDLKNNSEKTVKFKDFMKDAEKSHKTESGKKNVKTTSIKSSKNNLALPGGKGGKSNVKGR